ncbi:hypothetical protein [Paramuribaculum intestinale]|uniref:hypothetical protein n=1 Tax=Paramuribaculum intestinale TaxID=2094151 RepID=UPI0025A93B7E|nr:hypothetical protein [Paramuribaculum intestinale]
MAKFTGTKDEFIDLFGATLLTNAVKYYTRSIRKAGQCSHCGRQTELQAAHIKDTPGRIDMARDILERHYSTGGDTVEVDMQEFLELFYGAHLPLESHFIPLCDSCHKSYDIGAVRYRRPAGSNPFGRFGMPQKNRD